HQRSRAGAGRTRAVLRTVPEPPRRVTAPPPGPSAQAQIAGLSFAVLLLDPSGAIREANPVAEDMLGASAKRLIGQPWLDVVEILEEQMAERLRDSEARLTARGLAIRVGEREMLI